MAKYRLGLIGFAHMHINNVGAQFAQHGDIEPIACADTTPIVPEIRNAPYTRGWNLQHALDNLGFQRSYDDYQEMLEKENLDIVVCCSENARHAEVIEACAAAGVHVCVEKPMAESLSGALRMIRASQAAGTILAINWPMTWSAEARKIKELIDAGEIGRVLQVKWRGGHTGPLGPGAMHAGVSETADQMTGPERGATWWHQSSTGGGAMLDYCCYGSMVSRWYIGELALAVIGMKANLDSHWGNAEDNAAIIVRFPGAMALFEGSWTTWDHGVPTGPIVYGTEGTIVLDSGCIRREQGGGNTTTYQSDPLPEGRTKIANEFIHHLKTDEPFHQTLEASFNLEVMAILDAGIESAASGQLEPVNNGTWQIG